MNTLKDSALEALKDYQESAVFYENNIKLYKKKLEGDLSGTKRQCYEGLLDIAQAELKNCQVEIKRILEGKYGEAEEETPEEKEQCHSTLPFRGGCYD